MSKKLRQTNIIFANLTESKLKIILELCEREKIHFTFDKDYYSNEYYDIISLVDNIVTKKKEIPKIFKKLIENEYFEYLEDNGELEKLEKIKEIKYVDK